MILIVEEASEVVTFENTRSGDTFHAWLKEGTEGEWVVTRQGVVQAWGHPDVWGRAELRNGVWIGVSGNLPGTKPVKCRSRNDAFEWITNDRAEESV